jgi:membrane protein implicated in regulation of membrane protease activity
VLTLLGIVLAIFVLDGPWRLAAVAAGLTLDVAENVALVWWSRRRRTAVGPETLVGSAATVVTACRPRGQVRVAGELWRAECAEGANPGERVVVSAVDGLTLTVKGSVRGP